LQNLFQFSSFFAFNGLKENEMADAVIETEDVSTFKSPNRILVRFFHRSRDKWKAKYAAIKTEIKRYKNQASDARRSREQWKNKALALESRVQELEAGCPAGEQDKNRLRQ
jgi:hypothetical protein